MQQSEGSYDIHEKISQLETELLQHEVLIRRQKHVINSLKTMITSGEYMQSPPKNNKGSAGQNQNNNINYGASSSRSAPTTNNIQGATARNPTIAMTPAAATSKRNTAASVVPVRPINMQKKKSAMAKVILVT